MEAGGARTRVLVVDDEEANLRVFQRVFQRVFDVTVAPSVAEARRAIAAHPFDAVVVD